jgi:hypothetical protein
VPHGLIVTVIVIFVIIIIVHLRTVNFGPIVGMFGKFANFVIFCCNSDIRLVEVCLPACSQPSSDVTAAEGKQCCMQGKFMMILIFFTLNLIYGQRTNTIYIIIYVRNG